MLDEDRKNNDLGAARELALELEKYRQIVETASDAVVSINQDHEVVYMNRAAEEMFGYKRSEILGGDLGPLLPGSLRERHKHFVDRFVRTRRSRFMGHSNRVEAERADGTAIPISISINVAESRGRLMFTAIMRDRSTERSLARKVKRAEHLAEVGRMVATVSHEIRTPLTLIGGFARQLKKEAGISDNGRHKLGIIVDEVGRLEGLVNELNDLARPHRYQWEELDLVKVVRRIKELMAPKLTKARIALETTAADDLPLIMADRHSLSQVLINLINNAMEASRPGGRVSVNLAPDEQGGIRLEVLDRGCGIAPEHADKLFVLFFTTKRRGTGLGLAVAQRIVRDHGGDIHLENRPGGGAAARVTLPPAPRSGGA